MISVRNDVGAPDDPSGYYQFGFTEWADLEAAAQYALAHGARRLVVVGHSMGGGTAMSFLYRSSLADRVAGMVLDAPMLSFSQIVDFAAWQRHVPGPIAATAKWLAALRYSVDWKGMNHLDRVGNISAPVLLFHGDRDPLVPLQQSEQLAAERPDLVRLVVVAGAAHAASWNMDPPRYEQELYDFLARVSQ